MKSRKKFNRREFIGSVGLGSMATIVPRHVLGGKGFVAPSDKINIAYIGCGIDPGHRPGLGHLQKRCGRQEARRRGAEIVHDQMPKRCQGGLCQDLERHEARRRGQDQPREEVPHRRSRQLGS